jgi:uncharacterized protein (TIGR02246 family)
MSPRPITIAALLLLAFVGAPATADDGSAEREAGAALQHYVDVLRRQDASGVALSFEPDGSMAHEGGTPIAGRAAIRAFLDSFANYKIVSHEMTVTSVAVAGDQLTQSGTYAQTVRTPEGRTLSVSGTFVAAWRHQADGQWLLWNLRTASPGSSGG